MKISYKPLSQNQSTEPVQLIGKTIRSAQINKDFTVVKLETHDGVNLYLDSGVFSSQVFKVKGLSLLLGSSIVKVEETTRKSFERSKTNNWFDILIHTHKGTFSLTYCNQVPDWILYIVCDDEYYRQETFRNFRF